MSNDPNQPQQSPSEQTSYGQPPYGQPPWGVQPPLYGQPPKKRRRWLLPVVLAIIVGTLILACGGCFAAIFLVTFNSPPAIVAKQYYNAIKSQDYAMAYSYLDPNIEITFQGQSQQITQQAFTRGAQDYDTRKGKVSDYSITSVDLNYSSSANTGYITVWVTRNGTAYDVHLTLQQEGSDWKIVDFDSF